MAGDSQTGTDGEPRTVTEPSTDAPLTASSVGAPGIDTPPEVGTSEVGTAPPARKRGRAQPTAAGRVWVAIIVAVILMVLLIIFIAENSGDVTVSFLGTKSTLSLALAMLISAVVGALITLLVGTARILQLRREVKRRARQPAVVR